MNGSLPNWLAQLLGLTGADRGEGIAGRLESSWNWPAWLTLVFLLAAGGFIFFAYWSERGCARRWLKFGLATIRFGLVGLVLLMLAQWMLTRERTGLPYLVVAV
ncbi:MAG TPA: hypothetical protein VFE24_12410, partial [Pirellulales bacterium]|nr:hypothetical protein [Pirellulales bacterium]